MSAAALAGWVALLTQFAAPSAFAAGPYYWDNNGTTAGFGTAGGTWAVPTVSQWSTDSTGVAAPGASITTATTDTSENFGTAALGLGAGAVTVSGAVSSGPIVFGAGSGAITLSGGTSITLPAAATITVNNTKDIISTPLAGAATSLTVSGGNLVISNTPLPASTYNLASGAILELTAPTANPLANATTFNGTGTLKFDGGGNGVIGFGASGNDTVALSAGGSVQVSSNTVVTGSSGYHGIWNANLGSLTVDSGSTINFVEGGSAHAVQFDAVNGVGTISAGYAGATTFSVGNANGSGAFSGNLNDSSGGSTLSFIKNGTGTQILSGNSGYSTGTTINAGILEADSNTALGSGQVTLSGGTLSNNVSAILANAVSVSSASSIGVGSGQTFALNGVISSSGALAKTGAGTLALTGADTATGLITVNAGELRLQTGGSGAATITAVAGATNGVLVFSVGGQWASTGSLTNQTSSVLHLNFNGFAPSATVAPIRVASLTLGSTLTLRIDDLPVGFYVGQSYPLVTWTGGTTPSASAFTTLILPSGVSGNLSVSGSTLYLNVTGNTAQLAWNTGSGNWDTTTANWLNSASVGSTYVDTTSAVVFDDATGVTGNPTVTLNSAFSPQGVLMKSASHNYTISGTGAIGGTTSLTLDPANTQTLTLTTVNTYSGGTTIGGGALTISGSGSLGSGSYSGLITDNGTLNYNSSASQTWSGVFQGTGAFNYLGTGGLSLNGVNTYSGGTTLTNGSIVPGNGSAYGTGTVTINSGATSYPVAGSMTIPNTVVLNGGTWRIGGGGSHQLSSSGSFSVTANSSVLADGGTGYGVSGQTGGDWGSAQFINGSLNMGSTTNTLTTSGQNGITINGSISGANGTILNPNGGTYLWLANASNPFAGTLRAGGGYIILGYSGANSVYYATLDMNAADAGAFQIDNYPLTIGGLMGTRNLTLAGAVSIGIGNASTTYSGNLTNSSSVTKIGTGTLTLAGANSIGTNTIVSAGTLALSGSATLATTNIIVANNAIFNVSGLTSPFALGSTQIFTNSATGAILNGTNNCSIGTLSLVFDGVTPSFIQTNGGMTLSASTVIKVNNTGAQLSAGTRILIAAAQTGNKGLVAGALPSVTVSGGGAAGAVSLKIDTFGNLDLVVAGTVEEWTGTTSTSWGTAGNWITGVIPGNGSNVVFDAQSTNNLATVLDTGYSLSSLSLNPSPGGPVSIGGASTLTLTNGINLLSGLGQNLTLTAPVVLGAAQTWTVSGPDTLTVNNLSGSGQLTLAGGGTVVMNGANSTTGNDLITGGTTFRATASSAFPSSGTFYVINNGSSGTIDMNGSTLTSGAYVSFPYNSTTTLTNGTLICSAGPTGVPNNENYNFMGTINLAPNANYISNKRFVIGYQFSGFTTTINSLNGSTSGSLTWGGDSGGNQSYIGVGGDSGTLNINGGTVNFTNATTSTGSGYLNVGANNAGSSGTINLNGANMNVGTYLKLVGVYNSTAGVTCTGTLTVTNGAVTVGGGLDAAYNGVLFMDGGNGDATANTGTSTLTLNSGGLLTVEQIQAGNQGTKTINLNGGTIIAGINASNLFMPAATGLTVNLQAGGATFNSGANSITIGSVLGSTGGLTKTGTGLLTLTNANTYSGLTTISAGELKFSTLGSGTSTMITAANATNGVLLASTGGQWVTTGNLTNQNSSVLHIDYNGTAPSTTTAPLKVANFVPVTGLTLLINNGVLTAGQSYPLVTWTGSGPANGSAFTTLVLPRVTGNLSVTGSTLYLNVTASTEPLTWNTGNGNWDASTANWVDTTLASAAYIDGLDQVVFDDASGATGNPTVTLNSTFSPAAVTMKSTSHNYTISGTGGIGGGTSLLLDPANTKTLTLATINTYTGSTTIGGGKLLITGTLGNGNYAGSIAISNSATLEYTNNANQTFSGAITGAGALTADASGTPSLTLSGTANTYNGLTTISNGIRIAAGPANLSPNTTFKIVGNSSGGGQLFLNAAGTVANNMTLSGVGFADTSINFGAIRTASGTILSGVITLGGNARIGGYGGSGGTITGQVTGSGGNYMEFLNGDSGNNNSGTFILQNTGTANNYNGNTLISLGDYSGSYTGCKCILKLGANEQIPNGAGDGLLVFNGADANHISVFELNGFNETVNGVSNVNAASAIIQNTSTGASTLTIGDGNTNSSYSGLITDGGAGKTLGITKIGTGALTLSGANNYAGGTTISNGTLALGASGTLPATTTVNLAGGTLAMSTFNNTVNALQFNGSILARGTWGASGGGANHISASMTGTGILTVSAGGSSTSVVASSTNPSTYGSVIFTNMVTGSGGDGSAPSGTVTFYDGATAIGTGTLASSSGTASIYTLTLNSLTVGTHSITAYYAGNASYDVSTSSALSQVVNPATSTATVAVNNSPATYNGSGQAATVTLSGTNTAGSVSVLTGGAATQTAAGTYAVTATFVPLNTNYTTLTGLSAGNFTMNKAVSTATVTVNNSPVTYTGSAQAATVTLSGTNTLGSVTGILTGGAATQTAAGTYAVTAAFVPLNTNYTTLTGLTAGNFTIGQANTVVTLDTTTNFIYTAAGQTPTNVISSLSTGAWSTNYYGLNVSYNSATAPTNAGIYALTNAVVSDSNTVGATNGLQFTIAPVALTLAPTTNVKIYDTTTSATNVPAATSLQGADTVSGTTVVYDNPNVGTGKTLSVTAYTVNDGNGGANYTVTLATSTGGEIDPAASTATVAVNNSPTTYTGSAQAATVTLSGTNTAGSVTGILTGGAATQTAAGTYAVTATFVPLDTNYTTLTGLSAGNFTIGLASTFVGASSSENPSGYQDSISFTATLPSDATGSVVFSSTNGPISTNRVGSGTATSLSITNLPRGTNVITVAYLGDGNYLGSTTSLNQIVTNHPPVASVLTVAYTAGLPVVIALSDLATNWSDVDGDTVELTAFSPVTTNGVTLFPINLTTNLDGSYVITNVAFLGYDNSSNLNDQFSYSISDGQGGTNIGYVNLVVVFSVTGTNSIVSIVPGSSTTLTAYGIPGYTYITERATNLAPALWVDIATNTAATNGVINATDTFWDLGGNPPASAFYQLKWQQP